MTFDFAGYFLRVHRQDKELAAHELICRECRIAREQQELQAAWDELQSVPSYIEREARIYNDIQSK